MYIGAIETWLSCFFVFSFSSGWMYIRHNRHDPPLGRGRGLEGPAPRGQGEKREESFDPEKLERPEREPTVFLLLKCVHKQLISKPQTTATTTTQKGCLLWPYIYIYIPPIHPMGESLLFHSITLLFFSFLSCWVWWISLITSLFCISQSLSLSLSTAFYRVFRPSTTGHFDAIK